MRSGLALVLVLALVPPAAAEEPRAAPAEGGSQPAEPAPDDRPPRVPVIPRDDLELPPPRAIAEPPPRARRWPDDLARRTSLGLNLLAFVPGPEAGASGTWRVEAVLERALRPTVGAAAILSGGQVRKDGRDDASSIGLSGQYRWYFAGRFDRGAYLAGTLGFWLVDPYIAWSLGGGIGLKHTFRSGFTIDLLAGLQLPVDSFRTDDGGNPPALEDAWRALLPGPLVSVGGAFDEGSTGSRPPRGR